MASAHISREQHAVTFQKDKENAKGERRQRSASTSHNLSIAHSTDLVSVQRCLDPWLPTMVGYCDMRWGFAVRLQIPKGIG